MKRSTFHPNCFFIQNIILSQGMTHIFRPRNSHSVALHCKSYHVLWQSNVHKHNCQRVYMLCKGRPKYSRHVYHNQ